MDKKMKILIFNLRDIKNPSSGGAEVFTHEVAKRLVQNGNKVTMIVSNFKNGKKNEILDGIEIIRLGNMFTVHFLAKIYYNRNLKERYDVIIDEYTFKPFLTPNYVKEPVIFLAHELAREKYFYELPPIISHIFYYYIEPNWLKCYSTVPTITVSQSTKEDLAKFGVNNVFVVPEGIKFTPLKTLPEKEESLTLLFVGLLKKANLVDHTIESFKLIKEEIPDVKLWIVGRGSELQTLQKLKEGYKITLFGYVDEEKKLELMGRAHILLVPAIREGWGLVVTEANACGTPAIGYNVNGLRDSIKNNETGLLTENNPHALANAIIKLYKDKNLLNTLSSNALESSKYFNWDNTSNEFSVILSNNCYFNEGEEI